MYSILVQCAVSLSYSITFIFSYIVFYFILFYTTDLYSLLLYYMYFNCKPYCVVW